MKCKIINETSSYYFEKEVDAFISNPNVTICDMQFSASVDSYSLLVFYDEIKN